MTTQPNAALLRLMLRPVLALFSACCGCVTASSCTGWACWASLAGLGSLFQLTSPAGAVRGVLA